MDGLALDRARFPWLNQRGHLGLPADAAHVEEPLQRIFEALGGITADQARKSTTALPGDFIHTPSGLLIEMDEYQHFTSHRDLALSLYPTDAPLSFSALRYRELCAEWSARSDRYRRTKAAVGFGGGGRQRQRAYHDSLRDLVAPAMGHPPVLRVPVLDGNGIRAYAHVRDQLQTLTQMR